MTITGWWAVGIGAGLLLLLFLVGYGFYGHGYNQGIKFANESPGDTTRVVTQVELPSVAPLIQTKYFPVYVATVDTAAVDSLVALKRSAIEAAYQLSQSFSAEDEWETMSVDKSFYVSGSLFVTAFPIDKSFSWKLTFDKTFYNRESILKTVVVTAREPWWIKPSAVASGVLAAYFLQEKKYMTASVFGGLTAALVIVRWEF